MRIRICNNFDQNPQNEIGYKKGSSQSTKRICICLTSCSESANIEKSVLTSNGFVRGIMMSRIHPSVLNTSMVGLNPKTNIDDATFHRVSVIIRIHKGLV